MQISPKEIWYIIIGITMLLLFFTCVFIVIVSIGKKRKLQHQQQLAAEQIKLQQALLEKKDAVIEERNRIIADLHDEIGGGLSTIKLMAELSLTKANETHYNVLEKISGNSRELSLKMNEIVWTLNHKNDSLQGMVSYIRQYVMTTLDDVEIKATAHIEQIPADIEVDGNSRREIFLMVKEITNNIIKHSKAATVMFSVKIEKGVLLIEVADDGIGVKNNAATGSGFGLQGLQNRASKLNAGITWQNKNGTTVKLSIPV